MKTVLNNCKIINHDGISNANIIVEGGVIIDITNEKVACDRTIDCKGLPTLPGLIDMHVHMREPGYEYKEDITTAANACVAGGITSACCMANTKPIIDNSSISSHVIARAKMDGLIDLFPYGAVTKGLEGAELTEMGDLLSTGVAGFSDDGRTIMNAEVMRRALEYARHFGSFIATHSIDTDLQGSGSIHEGSVSSISGLKGIPSESETTIVARDILLAKLTKSRVHVCHISAKGTVDLLRWAKEQGINVTAEVAPHHFTLTDESCLTYDTNCKMSPPLRSQADVDAIIQGLHEGIVDCIATDHAPHMADEKFVEFDLAPTGIIGLQTLIPLTLKLIESGKLTWQDFVRVTSFNPAKILGKSHLGKIEKGMQADITVINPDDEYVFDKSVNKSKCMNTPYFNKMLKGRAIYTIKKGNLVFSL